MTECNEPMDVGEGDIISLMNCFQTADSYSMTRVWSADEANFVRMCLWYESSRRCG